MTRRRVMMMMMMMMMMMIPHLLSRLVLGLMLGLA
jgi:hypothetical protein